MRILLHGLNYSPELTGIGKYTGEMGAWLAARGHEVRVVTAPPYYPAWSVGAPYSAGRYQVEKGEDGITIYRCPLHVPAEPGGVQRIIHLFSFALSSLPVLLFLSAWKPDVIFMVEPTFFGAPVALLTGAICNAPCWLHIQDFEVDAAFELGLLPANGPLQSIALAFERFFTRRFARVSSISFNMLERISLKGVASNRTLLFPNWIDIDSIGPMDATSRYREELGLNGKFVLLYSGNLGNKQGLEILDALCEAFRDDPNIHFLVCGDGSLRSHIHSIAATQPNLTLLPLQPLEQLNELLNTADVHLLPQRSGGADLFMPSKLTGMLASGRPVITTALPGTQVAEVIGGNPERGLEPNGLIVPPDDVTTFCQAIQQLRDDIPLRMRMGAAARQYAELFLDKENILRSFESSLLTCCINKTPPASDSGIVEKTTEGTHEA